MVFLEWVESIIYHATAVLDIFECCSQNEWTSVKEEYDQFAEMELNKIIGLGEFAF